MANALKKIAELDAVLKKQTTRPRDNHNSESASEKKIEPVKVIPKLPDVKPSGDEEMSAFWRKMRSFYREGQGGGILGSDKQPVLYPALLSPYRDMRRVRFDYPVWIADESNAEGDVVISLTRLLEKAVVTFAPAPQDAKILKDNMARLEMIVRENMDVTVCAFSSLMDAALQKLESHLKIKGAEAKNFSDDIQKLKNNLPTSGYLIAFSHETPFRLMAAAIRSNCIRSKRHVKDDAEALRSKLEELIRVESQKGPGAKAPDKLKGEYGYGASFIDFNKFSSVIPDAATEMMPAERLARIEKAAEILRGVDGYFNYDCVAVVEQGFNGMKTEDWAKLFSHANIQISDKRILCSEAQNAFETHMASMAELLGALRIARLECEDHYQADIHDAYFAGFDWRSFSEEEMALCPPVIMITPVNELVHHDLTEFSRMLASHKPIKTMVIKSDAQVIHTAQSNAQPHFSFSQELGAMAVSHRNAYVFQSTAIHPDHLFNGFSQGISGSSPALFYILSPKESTHTNPYVWSGAALESRVFPEFTYDQKQGVQWGSRFNVEKNPQAGQDWPLYELEIAETQAQKSLMSIPFTFADFAAQDIHFTEHFLNIPPEYWTDDLVPFSEYLKMSPTEAYSKIPYVWMVDKDNVLHKAAVTHYLALVAQERLDFWHFIQEFGGINSYHVERAIEKVKQDMLEEKKKEIAAIEEKHAREIEEVRASTAREAMEKLSGILLDLDTLPSLATRSAEKSVPSETAATVAPEKIQEPEVKKEAEEEAVVSSEPWLESFRCTSCNECINVNPNMFKYNSTKQAFIADAKSGTYAQLVKAAEKCPAKCIHPGMPLNSAEAGLEELIKRAASFN